ncbi:hypothetical protein NBO_34g0029 [Nosema bombycis CQ1]|uniref:Uncharacterized protein n=1 Tax=Nosema bombycis (strain CQ1 / CVCC 102059) TaxID=578461 RepID=R0M853_NOSB1|nr:hypothetical protein NBO_34g0029 [Nosema bombycis CQ1]|eukprot:EOB14179.1 hypothetical protein NBO_34g0029 [Nosema bombycis CQ1]
MEFINDYVLKIKVNFNVMLTIIILRLFGRKKRDTTLKVEDQKLISNRQFNFQKTRLMFEQHKTQKRKIEVYQDRRIEIRKVLLLLNMLEAGLDISNEVEFVHVGQTVIDTPYKTDERDVEVRYVQPVQFHLLNGDGIVSNAVRKIESQIKLNKIQVPISKIDLSINQNIHTPSTSMPDQGVISNSNLSVDHTEDSHETFNEEQRLISQNAVFSSNLTVDHIAEKTSIFNMIMSIIRRCISRIISSTVLKLLSGAVLNLTSILSKSTSKIDPISTPHVFPDISPCKNNSNPLTEEERMFSYTYLLQYWEKYVSDNNQNRDLRRHEQVNLNANLRVNTPVASIQDQRVNNPVSLVQDQITFPEITYTNVYSGSVQALSPQSIQRMDTRMFSYISLQNYWKNDRHL